MWQIVRGHWRYGYLICLVTHQLWNKGFMLTIEGHNNISTLFICNNIAMNDFGSSPYLGSSSFPKLRGRLHKLSLSSYLG